jgi:alkanesulfonate monooxygenase SsuD/methylene tetrahydromethanopterin reductase-like flavin-dependent oxidoreductase (luciferase family)
VTGGAPFGAGSIALKLYAHDLPATTIVETMRAEAQAAEAAGFDGVVVSEHHREVLPGYLPDPLQAAGWILDATERIWAAPAPLLVLLRSTPLIIEQVAWAAAAHPGRIGLGVASGGVGSDFILLGLDQTDLVRRYAAALDDLASALGGSPPDDWLADRAVRRLKNDPIPLVSAAASSVACRRAASAGFGILLDSQITADATARYFHAYIEAGGSGPRVLVRRVWVGKPPVELLHTQVAGYKDMAPDYNRRAWADPAKMIVSGSPGHVADQLAEVMETTGATALNLRVHIPGISASSSTEQIGLIGTHVLPALRQAMPRSHKRAAAPSAAEVPGTIATDVAVDAPPKPQPS